VKKRFVIIVAAVLVAGTVMYLLYGNNSSRDNVIWASGIV